MGYDLLDMAWKRLRNLENFYRLPSHLHVSIAAAALAEVAAHAYTRMAKAPEHDSANRTAARVIHFGLDVADDLFLLSKELKKQGEISEKALKSAFFSALEGSLFSTSIHTVARGLIDTMQGQPGGFTNTVAGLAGFAATLASMSIVGAYYERTALEDNSFLAQALAGIARDERKLAIVQKRIAPSADLSKVYDILTQKDRSIIASTIGDVYASSLASIAFAGLIAAPVITSLVKSIAGWMRSKMDSAPGVHGVLEGSGGRKTRKMMDLPYDPESPPNPIAAAWYGVSHMSKVSMRHSMVPLSHLQELAGGIRRRPVVVDVPVLTFDKPSHVIVKLSDSPVKRIDLLRKLERRLALEV